MKRCCLVLMLLCLWLGKTAYTQDYAPTTFEAYPPTNAQYVGRDGIDWDRRRAQPEAQQTRCMQGKYCSRWPVVQVANGRPGELAVGTGVSIGRLPSGDRLFLTARHVVDPRYPVRVVSQGLDVPARVRQSDASRDIALLQAPVPDEHPLNDMELAPETPPDGSVLPWGGFAPDEGQYRQYEAPTQELGPARLWSRGSLPPGLSGGVVYTAHRPVKLVGIITARGACKDWALAVNARWIRGWLASTLRRDELASISRRPMTVPRDWRRINHPWSLEEGVWEPVVWHSRSRLVFGRVQFNR